MKDVNFHLSVPRFGIETVDHFDRGAGVASKGQGVENFRNREPEHDGSATQAIARARRAMPILIEVR